MIPYGRQQITSDDIAAVSAVLTSDFLTQGPMVPAFEHAMAAYVGAAYAVACNSATSALHLACLALGLGVGDRLWTSPISFVASANCARYCQADVDFIDVDAKTGLISLDALADKLQDAARRQQLPKIIVVVHLAGHSSDMAAIAALTAPYGIALVEDASHAVGAHDGVAFVGACRFSACTIFSFHPVKLITTAEGGMFITQTRELAEKVMRLRSHGITRDVAHMTEPSHGAWYYQQLELGFNYRLTDMQAALGLSQLMRLESFIQRRHDLVQRYQQLLQHLPLDLPSHPHQGRSSWHLYIIRLHDDTRRAVVFDKLRHAGIGVNVHYIPIHTQPYYQALGFCWGDFPQAEQFYSQIISLPLHPGLTDAEQLQVVHVLEQALAMTST
jgi:UDP-4-amino-4,6-dideoxy-N-acetyl-beta-L-altrosamine transaminase